VKIFNYGIDYLTTGIALEIAHGETKGVINNEAREKINFSYKVIEQIVSEQKVLYGVTTGFGPLCTTFISKEETTKLQENILKSHSVGIGDIIPEETSRLMLILKLHALCQGYSGISIGVLERICLLLEKNIIPTVPSQGSVGASGDLAPLAHLFLPLIGLGEVFYNGKIEETAKILQNEGLKPMILGPKEGLALINGTQFIAAFAIKAVERLQNCLDTSDIIGAMSLEALLGSSKPFKEELHKLRPFKGSLHVAHRLRELLFGSEIIHSHLECSRVQDPYSLRCIPQVHGATRNAWLHLKELLHCELNSVTDNPIVLDAENTISGGNFHGQPLALPLDYCGFAAAEIGNISDRRTYLLLEGKEGLPLLLMKNTGINSGFMIPQYTSAALVSENKAFSFPASVDSITTSLGQEDHVSMGSISGRKTNMIIDNLEKILAVELTCAAQAFDFRKPLKSTIILESCHQLIRENICHAENDRVFSKDIAEALELIKSKRLADKSYSVAKEKSININGQYDELFGLY
jgi:histidine ammonia-lyase